MSFQDTKERIFRNGQIYSRPRFGGSVHGPDTRPPFRLDTNPYDVPPEPRGYGQGYVGKPELRDFLFRSTDTFDIQNPVYRPGVDQSEVQPLEVATNYTTYTDVLPKDVENRRRYEDAMEEKSPAIKLDPSKLDLREYRQPGPYRPGEDLDKDRFIRSDRSPIASNPETGKRDFLYQYLEQNKELMGPKNQMFERYADPDDGTLVSVDLPTFNDNLDDGQRLREAIRSGDIDRIIPGFTERRLELRRKLAPFLRGV